jgi:acyl-coenzyme A thioesterase PaaI-like protein
MVRAITADLVDPDLPAQVLDDLEELLTSARDASSTRFDQDPSPVPNAETNPWVGLSNAIAPPMTFHLDDDVLVGVVECSRVYGGAVNWVHGGVIAGLFDAIIATRGALSGAAVTADLSVHYRRPVPVDRGLRMDAKVDRVDGRKCFVSARMFELETEVLVAEAAAMLVPYSRMR